MQLTNGDDDDDSDDGDGDGDIKLKTVFSNIQNGFGLHLGIPVHQSSRRRNLRTK